MSDNGGKNGNKKMAMAVMSGDMDKLFGAFIIATSAAASNVDVTMFFTFWGLRALKKNARTGKSLMGKMMGAKKVATLPELRQMALDLGVKFYGCQMSMDVMEIPRESMIDEVEDCVGGGFFVEKALEADAQFFI
jgi:peroxiredoxin family protein